MKITLDLDTVTDAAAALAKLSRFLAENPGIDLPTPKRGECILVWENVPEGQAEPSGPASYQLTIWGNPKHMRVRLWRVFPGSASTAGLVTLLGDSPTG